MLCYYNAHESKNRGKFSRFPEHHWVSSSMIYAFYPTTFLANDDTKVTSAPNVIKA